jgi:hypothetical protein
MTQSREAVKQHGNKVHGKQRVPDEQLYRIVQLQSWFDDRKARYWIVEQSKQDEQERQTRRAKTRGVVTGSWGGIWHRVGKQLDADVADGLSNV